MMRTMLAVLVMATAVTAVAIKSQERPLWPQPPNTANPHALVRWAQNLTRQLTMEWEKTGYRANIGTPKDGSEEADINILPDGSVIADKLTEGAQSFATDIEFSASDHETVAWTAGSILLADGTSHSIQSGNTGAMTGATYIYLDTDLSTTQLQVTATLGDTVGDHKQLVAFARPAVSSSQNAFFVPSVGVFGVNEEQISANAISANLIQANAVTASKINVAQLSAISADMGTLTAGVVRDPNQRFVLDLAAVLQTISDAQSTPVDRVKIGKLGAGNQDYGVEVYDASGSLILSATGLGVDVVDTTQIVDLAVTDGKIDSITADKITAGTITGSTLRTAASGKRFEVTAASNEAKFFNSSGNERVSIGTDDQGNAGLFLDLGNNSIVSVRDGVSEAMRIGVDDASAAAILEALLVEGAYTYGIHVQNAGSSGFPDYGLYVSDVGKGGIRLPNVGSGAPTHSADVGTLWVDGGGVLYINTLNGWEKVGAQ